MRAKRSSFSIERCRENETLFWKCDNYGDNFDVLALLGFIGWSVLNRTSIQYWGRRSTVLLVFGLVVCCFAAARDGLDKTIQHAIDGSCAPGLFPLVSVPTIVGCVGALLIIVAAIATPIAGTQKMREIWFYVMSSGAVLKIATMEIARVIL